MEQKKRLALEIIDRLRNEYPDAECSLDYNEAWKLLVSVRLAAQCTDARVNVVVEKLYEKFPDVNALANAEVDEIEEIVRPCGLGRSKARDISACMRVLHEKYDDHVPETFEELLALPGVGRKSANLIKARKLVRLKLQTPLSVGHDTVFLADLGQTTVEQDTFICVLIAVLLEIHACAGKFRIGYRLIDRGIHMTNTPEQSSCKSVCRSCSIIKSCI